MGVLDFVCENGQFAGGQRKWQTDSCQVSQKQWNTSKSQGPCLDPAPLNAKVKILKVIMLRSPSWSRYLHVHLFKKKGR